MRGADKTRILTEGSKHQLRWLLGNIHVGSTYLEVLSEVERKVKRAPIEVRGAALQYALLVHHHNRTNYRRLMRGY